MRKSATVVVPAWGCRDDGKAFRIDEMPAAQAEKWGMRMFLAIKGTAGGISDEVASLGMVGVAIRGLNAFLAAPVRFDEVEPLLDEMMGCVKIIRDPRHPEVATPINDSDIEEVRTMAWLRSEVLNLHTGFHLGGALSALLDTIKASPGSQSM